MATFSMSDQWDGSHTQVIFCVEGLQNPGDEYDKFVVRIEQRGVQITEIEFDPTEPATGYHMTWEYPNYLGANPLSPDCTYTAYLDCHWNTALGEIYTLNSVKFTTNSISPPSISSITPSVYATIRNQNPYETCVADSLACAMEIFKMKKGITYEKFSTAYIYGSDGNRGYEGMNFAEAVDNCINYGSPRYEIFSGLFPDSTSKSEAINMFNTADNVVKNNAIKQRFRRKYNIDFYDCDLVADYIQTYGYFMFNFHIPENFRNIDSSGIVPQPDEWRGGTNNDHSMALIGLTMKNGKPHWIAQNSWGESWGQNGRCFIPYDWGCGVQSPMIHGENNDGIQCTSWTWDCYAIAPGSGYTADNPTKVYNLEATQDGITKNITLSWDSDEVDGEYVVLARQAGTDRWYTKATTTNTTIMFEVDRYTRYEFMIITMVDSYCSPQSDIIVLSVNETEYDLIIYNLSIYRDSNTLRFYWDGAPDATGYNIRLTRNYDGYQHAYIGDRSFYTCTGLEFGVTYTVDIQAYNDEKYGEWTFNQLVTTLPSTPIVTASHDNGYVTVDYSFEYATNVSYLNITVSSMDYGIQESVNIDIDNGNQNPSGSYVFSEQHRGDVWIYIDAYLKNLPDKDLEYDNYQLMSYADTWITIDGILDPWNWSSDIALGKRLTIDEDGIHPITADEWNDFTARINEFRVSKNYEEYAFPGVSPGDDFMSAYNDVVDAIKEVEGYGGYLSYIDEFTLAIVDGKFRISLFDIIRSEANAIAGYYD